MYVPSNRNNLASFVSVSSDANSEDYGKLRVLELANADEENESQQTPGPGQVANEFVNSTKINQIAAAAAQQQRPGHLRQHAHPAGRAVP